MTTPAAPPLETATWARRIGALFIDWLTCLTIAQGLVATGVIASNPNGLATLGLFVAESALFTALLGGSFGKIAVGLRVVRQDGTAQPLGLLPAVLRTVLVALVVPPLFTMGGRGLHDVAVGTRTVRT